MDSIAANYRAESLAVSRDPASATRARARRAASLVRVGTVLRDYACRFDCAVAVSNQVADRIPPPRAAHESGPSLPLRATKYARMDSPARTSSPIAGASAPPSSGVLSSGISDDAAPRPLGLQPDRQCSREPVMSVDHQLRFFTGWGDRADDMRGSDTGGEGQPSLKTPALGLVWANQLAARLALTREAAWAPQQPAGGWNAVATAYEAAGRGASTVQAAGGDARCQPGEATTEESAEWAPRRWRRWCKVVFAAWTAPVGEGGRGIEFEVWEGGVRSISSKGKEV